MDNYNINHESTKYNNSKIKQQQTSTEIKTVIPTPKKRQYVKQLIFTC